MKSKRDESESPSEAVTRCWCSTLRKQFGLVLVKSAAQGWELRHSYTVSESYHEAECQPLQMRGGLSVQDDYNGCKWCGDRDIFQCGACQSFNCQGSKQ